MLDYSIGEAESLVLKAYRGAGFSWGMAQEAGNAAAWMSMYGLPGIAQFAQLLPVIDGKRNSEIVPLMHVPGEWRNPTGVLCPVVAGTAFTDGDYDLSGSGLMLANVLQPLILLPFVSQSDQSVELVINNNTYICGSKICACIAGNTENAASASCTSVTIRHSTQLPDNSLAFSQRALVNPADVDLLSTYAHRTYVPASEASRLAGAGAGLLDND